MAVRSDIRKISGSEYALEKFVETTPEPDAIEMPRSVRVGPWDWAVNDMSQADCIRSGWIGSCYTAHLEIEVYPKLPTQKRAEVLLHEVLHACFEVANLKQHDTLTEEKVVNGLGMTLLSVIRDNPDLIAFLTQASKAPR